MYLWILVYIKRFIYLTSFIDHIKLSAVPKGTRCDPSAVKLQSFHS